VPDPLNNPLANIPAFFPGVESVCSAEFSDNAPPWRSDRLWQAANHTLHYLIDRHQHQLDHLKQTAGRIKDLFASVNSRLDSLCSTTCAQCVSPCCLVADVSYDFKDLLFIHLADQAKPPGQPRRSAHDVCCFLGPEGCRIPRLERPWICTWYICAAQKDYLTEYHPDSLSPLLSAIEQVKMLRNQMEELFIRIVAS
jgi:hypothetical protein